MDNNLQKAGLALIVISAVGMMALGSMPEADSRIIGALGAAGAASLYYRATRYKDNRPALA